MDVKLEKYSGAGNDFIVIDGRSADVPAYRGPGRVRELCSRKDGFTAPDGTVGADGLMILSSSESSDFRMEFFNPDGSSGMMCGNGGRCIAAFADSLGIRPRDGGDTLVFEAPDGLHTARILSREGSLASVCLGMKDVDDYRPVLGGWFLDTGTRHFVRFVPDVDGCDVVGEGRRIRNLPEFAPEGTNVNFVSALKGEDLSESVRTIRVRTYEKGVEDETFACGTGIVASAIASFCHCYEGHKAESPVKYEVHAKRDVLTVDFMPSLSGNGENCRFTGVWLSGPAVYVAKIMV